MTLSARLKLWSGVLRDVLAVLAVPVITLLAVAMTVLMWRGGWDDSTQAQRLTYFGCSLLALIALMGFALFWLQRLTIDKVSLNAGTISATLDLEAAHEADR